MPVKVNPAHHPLARIRRATPCAGGGGTGEGEALPRCHALLQALSQALRDAASPFPCVGCTNISWLLK